MQHTLTLDRSARRAAAAGLLLLAAACGGDDNAQVAANSQADNAKSVDQESSATATEREVNSFRAPADSLLTPQQVEAFLRTTLVQFDLIRQEAPQYHAKVAEMEKRGEKGGLIAGLRNVADAGNVMVGFGDLVGGSYVRSARSLNLNPAEMEWVRERMSEVSIALALQPMLEGNLQMAQGIRQQAESYRGQPGFDDASIQEMLKNADEMEKNARQQMSGGGGAVTRNMEVLRRARPNVTNHMWSAVALVGGSGGLLGLTGLANPGDTTAVRQMNEWRRIYTDALANQVTPGLEASVPPAEARPRLN
jgi:ElaB/YqjD/DUF883 family membrane-anchored ribosome-binding protein